MQKVTVPRVMRVKTYGVAGLKEFDVTRCLKIIEGHPVAFEFVKDLEAKESVLQRVAMLGKELWSFKRDVTGYDHKVYAKLHEFPQIGYCIVLEFYGILEVIPVSVLINETVLSSEKRMELKHFAAKQLGVRIKLKAEEKAAS